MRRTIYVAGINTWTRLPALSVCNYWLLSVTQVRTRAGIPKQLQPYLPGRKIIWDPGTFSDNAISYLNYRRFIEDHVRPEHDYLQYDEIGDPEATAWYLADMRRRGFNPIPILQPGGSEALFDEPRLAIGGIARKSWSWKMRFDYLDKLFYPPTGPRKVNWVHLLGMGRREVFERYPAASGDATTWIPRQKPHRRKSIAEWMEQYGEQDIPLNPPTMY